MERVKIDDFAKIQYLSDLSCSPNGNVLAFVKSEASVKENCYKSAIWLMEDGKCRRLTTGGNESAPLWLDDEHLLFPGDRKKEHKPAPGAAVTVYNRINIHGGEAEVYFTVPMKCGRIKAISASPDLFVRTKSDPDIATLMRIHRLYILLFLRFKYNAGVGNILIWFP